MSKSKQHSTQWCHSTLPYCEDAVFLSNGPLFPQLMGEQQVREVNYGLVLYYTIGQLPAESDLSPLAGKTPRPPELLLRGRPLQHAHSQNTVPSGAGQFKAQVAFPLNDGLQVCGLNFREW